MKPDICLALSISIVHLALNINLMKKLNGKDHFLIQLIQLNIKICNFLWLFNDH